MPRSTSSVIWNTCRKLEVAVGVETLEHDLFGTGKEETISSGVLVHVEIDLAKWLAILVVSVPAGRKRTRIGRRKCQKLNGFDILAIIIESKVTGRLTMQILTRPPI